MLHSVDQYLVIDIPEQLIAYIFKGQGVQVEWTGLLKERLICCSYVGNKLSVYGA